MRPRPLDPLGLAAKIIGDCSRAKPADAVLRAALKAHPQISRTDSATVSRAVFAYFRWFGWLDAAAPISLRLAKARDLAAQFAEASQNFADEELRARAVPNWVLGEMEVSVAWVRALQTEPRLWLRARPGHGRKLASRLNGCRPFGEGALADIIEYRGSEDLFRTDLFHAGEFELQDLSSQAVGLACAPQPGETWWDACAGEGGKTLHLADLMQNRGLIWATDRAEWRLARLKRRAARAQVFNYRSRLWNGEPPLPTKTKFDGVLLDAPCSGLGTWGRNPHARWTTTLADVRELGLLQSKLLVVVADSVKPGGKLAYAVCTLARAETCRVVEEFEKGAAAFERLPLANPLQPGSEAQEAITLRPEDFGGNGMFIVAWRRK